MNLKNLILALIILHYCVIGANQIKEGQDNLETKLSEHAKLGRHFIQRDLKRRGGGLGKVVVKVVVAAVKFGVEEGTKNRSSGSKNASRSRTGSGSSYSTIAYLRGFDREGFKKG